MVSTERPAAADTSCTETSAAEHVLVTYYLQVSRRNAGHRAKTWVRAEIHGPV